MGTKTILKRYNLNSADIIALIEILGEKGLIDMGKAEKIKDEHYRRLTNGKE